MCSVLVLFVFVCAPAMADDAAADVAYARVYTARIQGAAGMSQSDLERIARSDGAGEVISFPAGGNPANPTSRTLVGAGSPGMGYPGFSVDVQQGLAYADNPGGTTALSGGVTISAARPQAPDEPLKVSCIVNGEEVISTSVYGIVDGMRPRFVEMMTPKDGATVVQVIDYLDAAPSRQELTPVTSVPDQTATLMAPVTAGVAASTTELTREDGVTFDGQLTGLSWNWDSKWWPGNGENPGGFPLQVRFMVGAGADIASHVDGNFVLHYPASRLQAGAALGDLEMNFGALISAQGALTILWFDPIVFNIPYVPQFDMQVYDHEDFNSYLLDSSATVADATGRQNLANVDVVSLIGGSWLPDWVKNNLNAGITIQGALSGTGTMTCDNISFSDGAVFTAEGESRSVTITPQGYQATATYNENLSMTGTLTLYPALFVNLAGWINWSWPVFELPWTFFNGPADLAMSTSDVDYPPLLVNLNLTKANPTYGQITLDPPPADANAPQYLLGTTVTLTAIPNEQRSFVQWEIYDPNHPGDANYRVIDTNNPLVIVMDSDKEIVGVFKCGGAGMGQVLPLLLVGLAVCGFVSRRIRQSA
jgi:hypothetical protein